MLLYFCMLSICEAVFQVLKQKIKGVYKYVCIP